ncbi:MAG: aminopeptidase P family protein [DPANN group archaeon]|nr:aminopeptidase P family protein [DPANN group archaeon]
MRLSEFSRWLCRQKLDLAFFLTSSGNKVDKTVQWLTGIAVSDFACLLVGKSGKATTTFVKGLELENARLQKHTGTVKQTKRIWEDIEPVLKKTKRIGVNMDNLSFSEIRTLRRISKAKLVDVSEEVNRLRELKTTREIAYLKKACGEGDAIFKQVIKHWKTFKTELDVAAFIVTETYSRGLTSAFEPIVATGKHAAAPHYYPTKSKLLKGFCVIDFGVRYKGYCSDMTRTLYVGKPTKEERARYELCLASQKLGVKMSTTGTKSKDIDFAVRDALGKEAKNFNHGLGHQVGLDVHENPQRAINRRGDFSLEQGMAITIEPGIYEPGKYGIRIEDTLIVGRKPIILTKTTKQLITV